MQVLKVNDRVRFTDKPFLSGGYIKKVIKSYGSVFYLVKLDEYLEENDDESVTKE